MKSASCLAASFIKENQRGEINGTFKRYRSTWGNHYYSGRLLIFGPKRLPELGQSIGKMFSEFKKAVNHAGEEEKTENKNEKE